MSDHSFQWAVVGAGPAGITAIGALLDRGVEPGRILWLDAAFVAGDFGQHWRRVNSNTTVALFLEYLRGFTAFGYDTMPQTFSLDACDPQGFCELDYVAEPLVQITNILKKQVNAKQCCVNRLHIKNGRWQILTTEGDFSAEKVILAVGSEPREMNVAAHLQTIPVQTALDPLALAQCCSKKDTVAVFGSSHSAMIIIRELVNIGVKKIINFYREPIRYALRLDGWTLYDNTGLKGETAKWVRANVFGNCLPSIERHPACSENTEKYSRQCSKVICAIGFRRRALKIDGIDPEQYDRHSGIIAPGLFGAGIAFPLVTVTPFGQHELNVGLFKFMKDIDKVMPIWFEYSLV